jgi:hypothetical protein
MTPEVNQLPATTVEKILSRLSGIRHPSLGFSSDSPLHCLTEPRLSKIGHVRRVPRGLPIPKEHLTHSAILKYNDSMPAQKFEKRKEKPRDRG